MAARARPAVAVLAALALAALARVAAAVLAGLAVAALAGTAIQAGARTLSLAEAVALARARNETILIARADERRAAGAVREAYAGAMPSLSLQGTYQRNFQLPAFFAPEEFGGGKVEMGSDLELNAGLRLDQVLYAFGRVGNAVAYAKTYKQVAGLGVETACGQVVFAAQEAYARALLMESLARIRGQSLKQARSHLREIEQKFEQGAASRFDLRRAQVEAKNREPELIRAENALELARQDLKRVLGLENGEPLELSDSLGYEPATVELESAIAEAFRRRPELRILEAQVAGSEKLLAIYRANDLPVLGLYGQVAYQGQGSASHPEDPFKSGHRQISTAVGLALQLPIFDGFRTRGRVEQARAGLRRAELELEQARGGVRLEVTQAVQELQSLQREHESQLATIALAEETLEIAEARFRNGISTQLELTDASTALDFARTHFAEMLYRYQVALAALERALGRAACGPADSTEE